MRLCNDTASATFCLSRGGRLASLVIEGHELLVTAHEAAFGWGAFPMVPYAGRIRRGRFEFRGVEYELPITMSPHAIHGTVWDQSWTVASDGVMETDLCGPWPFGGSVRQHADLRDDSLTLVLEVRSGDRAMPAMAGWHPWFRRTLFGSGIPEPVEAELDVDLDRMFELDDEAIPTGEKVAPPPGPWDNCFTMHRPPVITWPGVLELTLSSSHPTWVVYDRPDHAICVEPQTDAPDAFNRDPFVLEPDQTLSTTFTISWRLP